MILDIFKIPLYVKQLNVDCKDIENYCLDKKSKESGRNRSNRGGWQSPDLKDDELTFLFEEISINIKEFIKQLNFSNNYNFTFSNRWINVNHTDHYNLAHIHPYSPISGVFYVKGFDNAPITFFHPAEQLMSYDFHHDFFTETNEHTQQHIDLKGPTGLLYLFPGWLKHGVVPNLNNEERISISFNTRINKNEN